MKKQFKYIFIFSLVILSITSFVFLNANNSEFALFEFDIEWSGFQVSSSTLPDVEAVKNTLILIKEILLFNIKD